MDVHSLKPLLMSPIVFHDVYLEVIDVIDALHEPYWDSSYHKHPWYELNYVADGDVNVILNDLEFHAETSNCLLIPPNTFHRNMGTSTGDDGFCIRFSLQREASAKNVGCFEELSRILSTEHPSSFIADVTPLLQAKSLYGLQSALMQLLFSICETFEPDIYQDTSLLSPSISNQVMIYLHEYYRSKIRVEDIAKALNISYRALAKKFKAETGKSMIEALTEIRINAAKPLLINTNYTLAQIADMVGFEDESYFSKTFTRYTCRTPSDYRKN